MSLDLNWNDECITVDEFYKSLLFQRIMDGDFDRDERDVMLVILRKTLHYDKWSERLQTDYFSRMVGVCDKKLRSTTNSLEARGLIDVERSKGGRTRSMNKYNLYSLSNDLIFLVAEKWMQIKEESGFM